MRIAEEAQTAQLVTPHSELRAPAAPWLPSEESTLSEDTGGLPAVPRAADLARSNLRALWLALPFGVTLLVYLALIPQIIRYSNPPTGDQPYYMMVANSIVEDGDINLANNYAERDEDKFYSLAPRPPDLVGISAPYPLPQHPAAATARPPGEQYNFHWPGLSLWLVPVWIIGSWFQLWWPMCVAFMCLLGALVAVNVFLLAHELTGRFWIAVAVWVPISFSGPVLGYSHLLFTELPTGLLMIYAFRRLALGWGANGPARLMLVGASIAYTPWMAWRCVPIAGGLLLYAAVQWWRYRRALRTLDEELQPEQAPMERRNNGGILSLLAFFLPVMLLAALLASYHYFLFGRVIPGDRVPLLGDQSVFYWPWQSMDNLVRYATIALAQLFDGTWGLLPYTPIYLLAVVGAIAMFRSKRAADRRILLALAPVVLPYVGMMTAYHFWNGQWCPPARFLTMLMPLLAAPLAMSLFALGYSWLYKVIYAVLAIPGFIFAAIRMNDARLLWPGEQAEPFLWLANSPESPLRVNLRKFLPIFDPVEPWSLPANTGWMLVVSLLIIFACYALLVDRSSRGQRRQRPLPYAMHGVIWLAVIGVLGSTWLLTNFEYLKRTTTLTQVNRWELNPPPGENTGIAYLGGKVYVTDFQGKTMSVFDTQTGAYAPWVPISPTQSLSVLFARPGDVEARPDGTLYVLNNGTLDNGIYVMKPDGTIVRQLSLLGKTDIATGLTFGPDGSLYVADVFGGRTLKYAATGGEPLASYGGIVGGFNNPTGVAVDDTGMVYVSDSGFNRLQQLDPNGNYVRSFDLKCKPWHIALNGDWLDVTCDRGMVSVNKTSGALQLVRVDGGESRLVAPRGLTYAPDGTLYVVDGNALIQYRVQH